MMTAKVLSLRAHLDSAAASNPSFDLSALLAAVYAWLLSNLDPRRLIDTPEERKQIEDETVAAVDRLLRPRLAKRFGDVVASAACAVIEPEIAGLEEVVFTALVATLPPQGG